MSPRVRAAGARLVFHVLLVAILVVLSLIVKEWAYGTTFRLYLDARADNTPHSTATQRFALEAEQVVPRITMRDDAVAFLTAIARDSVVRAGVRPRGAASYEIRARQGGVERVLCRGDVTQPVSVACPYPTGSGTLTLATKGEITWADLRVQRNLQIATKLIVLSLLLAAAVVWCRAGPSVTPRGLRAWGAVLTLIVSTATSVIALEGVLRAVGARLVPAISAARHDLGEPTEDPRWQQSGRYGRRLSSNYDAANSWQQGDIIRMGYLSPALGDGAVHRYGFHSDAEGFRNAATRDRIDIAALGDSFTDALTMAVEDGWPMQLERRLGLAVQNYGTAGFGPQQELLVLKDYALRHRPSIVVLAFFAGNDIRDAEVFDEHGRVPSGVPALGWPIKDVISRFDTWFLVSALHAASGAVASSAPAVTPSDAARAPAADAPSFDRGRFTVPVKGRVLRFALMPPYLNVLNFSEANLEARRGWALTRESLADMQRASREAGAEFVVMFLPFKSQVYLPLLTRAFSEDALTSALHVSLQPIKAPADLGRMSRNRLALNALMRRFCESSGIPFFDTTATLTAQVNAGQNMYFPDDSHLNEAGQAVVAEGLAAFLKERSDRRLTSPCATTSLVRSSGC